MNTKPWPCLRQPEGCACHCHALKAGQSKSRKKGGVASSWTPERDDQLRTLLREGVIRPDIAKIMLIKVGAVRHRISDLGLSVRGGWYSDFEVQKALGVSWRFTRRWRLEGLLKYSSHDSSTWHRISQSDLEAFVREQAGQAVDVSRIKDPSLRRIAEVAAMANSRRIEAVS